MIKNLDMEKMLANDNNNSTLLIILLTVISIIKGNIPLYKDVKNIKD